MKVPATQQISGVATTAGSNKYRYLGVRTAPDRNGVEPALPSPLVVDCKIILIHDDQWKPFYRESAFSYSSHVSWIASESCF